MSDLYIENFYHRGEASATLELAKVGPATEKGPLQVESEETIHQVHFLLRVLTEEVGKEYHDQPPFPILLKKLENTLLSQNKSQTLDLLEELEEALDRGLSLGQVRNIS